MSFCGARRELELARGLLQVYKVNPQNGSIQNSFCSNEDFEGFRHCKSQLSGNMSGIENTQINKTWCTLVGFSIFVGTTFKSLHVGTALGKI